MPLRALRFIGNGPLTLPPSLSYWTGLRDEEWRCVLQPVCPALSQPHVRWSEKRKCGHFVAADMVLSQHFHPPPPHLMPCQGTLPPPHLSTLKWLPDQYGPVKKNPFKPLWWMPLEHTHLHRGGGRQGGVKITWMTLMPPTLSNQSL